MGAARRYCRRCGTAVARDNNGNLCSGCHATLDASAPPSVPPAFWRAELMRKGFGAGNLGAVLRAYRHHPHQGQVLAQETLAGWLHVSQATLSRIETGQRLLQVDEVVRIVRALGIPVRLACALVFDAPAELEPSDRHGLVRPAGADRAVEGDGLSSAVDVDPGLVPHWLEMSGLLVAHDRMFGSGSVARTAHTELGLISRHRQLARGALHVDLLRVEARWSALLGWLNDDLGNWRDGDYWVERATVLAEEAGDELMRAYALMRRSERAVKRQDAHGAIALAQAAQDATGLTSHVQALSACAEAQGHALAGDAHACQRKLEETYELVEREPNGEWVPHFEGLGRHYATRANTETHEAWCWLRLDQPRKAIDMFETTLAAWPRSRRRGYGVRRAGLALACVAVGEPERAAAEGLSALEIARSTRSSLMGRELARLDRRLARCHVPATAEFHDAFAAVALEVSTSTVCRSVLTPPGPGGHPSVGGS